MNRSTVLLMLVGLLAILALEGCTSQAQLLQQNQAMAIQEALGRGRFEMNCPDLCIGNCGGNNDEDTENKEV